MNAEEEERLREGGMKQADKRISLEGAAWRQCHVTVLLPLIPGQYVRVQSGGCYKCFHLPQQIMKELGAAICWSVEYHTPGNKTLFMPFNVL